MNPMDRRASVIERYLARHAEAETALAGAIPAQHDHVLTVPVYCEGDAFFRLLASLDSRSAAAPAGSALVIAVVNAREDSEEAVIERNRLLLSRLRDVFPQAKQLGDNARLHATPFGELLCVDRSSRARLPRKRGVGLARKIAGDLALALGAKGKIASRWIHFTDADAVLPQDYFARGSECAEALALIYPFRHDSPNAELRRAGALHEMFMRHYVVGLQSAGSPYAYHSIGSLIAVDASAYARVRGVPRRHGAEDFYLLNKLAKLGHIAQLPGSPIELEARASERVPFGTGPAIRRLIASSEPLRPFFHPQSFHYLAVLLGILAPALGRESPSDGVGLLREEGVARGLDRQLLGEMADFLELESLLRGSMARSREPATRLRDWHTKFDALRTLQLLHWLRDRALPSSDWRPAMSTLGLETERDPEEVLDDLIALEQRLCSGDRGLGRSGREAGDPLE